MKRLIAGIASVVTSVVCERSVTSLPSSYCLLFACDRQYDCIVRRYTHDSPGRYTPRSLADAETNTRRARPIGTITVVGIRKASDRVALRWPRLRVPEELVIVRP